MSAENVNAWWWMQPPSNRSLSLHLGQMQGDFRQMQGGGHRNPARSHKISIAWVIVSLLKRAGRSRENRLCSAGWWIYARKVECEFLSRRPGAPQSLRICPLEPRIAFASPASPFSKCQLDP